MSSILVCKSLIFVVGGLLGFAAAKIAKAERATFPRALAVSIICALLVSIWPHVETWPRPAWCGGALILVAMFTAANLMSTSLVRGLLTCTGTLVGLGLGWLGVALAEQIVNRGEIYTWIEGMLKSGAIER